ncbi:MAG: ribosome maturation factor RimP [Clostridia bacterium]|nr:ribosome maturation factor RimP [Clostridia bacterium]
MSKISEQIENFIEPIVTELGYEIVEVEFAKKHNGDNLTVFIDKKEGYIDITDCEKVHDAIDEPLDELDPTMGKPYTLNVSSPGIDRPIVTDKDYNRNLGQVLEVKLFQAILKKKIFIGKLLSFDESMIELETEKETIKLERKMISKATKYIEF